MIKKYKEHTERAEAARLELKELIEKKTGHSCAPHAYENRLRDGFKYQIICFSAQALLDISKLFVDIPFFREKVSSGSIANDFIYKVSCHVEGLDAPLEVISNFNKREYEEWLKILVKGDLTNESI